MRPTFPTAQWVVAGVLFSLFAMCAVVNAGLVLRGMRAKADERVPSLIPVLGGLVGAYGVYIAPIPRLHAYLWVPLLLDVGCGPYVALVIFAVLRDKFAKSNWFGKFRQLRSSADLSSPRAAFKNEHAIVGCILGTAVGDALGLPCEGLSKQRQARVFRDLSRYHFLPGIGMASDDTEHTLMVAQSLIETGSIPDAGRVPRFSRNFAWRLRFWILGLPAGVGLATLRAIIKLWLGLPVNYSGVYSAGNGAAMRVALIGVCFGYDQDKALDLVRAATRITHTDPRAEAGAQAVAIAAHLAAMRTTSITAERFLEEVRSIPESRVPGLRALAEDVCASVSSGETCEAFAARIGCANGVTGYVNHTVPVALHVWLNSANDYRAAVTRMVRLGGDTDTTAAIVGAIVGASVGKAGIPAEWLARLWEWPRTTAWMEKVGVKLAECCARNETAAAVPINPFKLLLRNAVFLIVVLVHGFRRLLPPY